MEITITLREIFSECLTAPYCSFYSPHIFINSGYYEVNTTLYFWVPQAWAHILKKYLLGDIQIWVIMFESSEIF